MTARVLWSHALLFHQRTLGRSTDVILDRLDEPLGDQIRELLWALLCFTAPQERLAELAARTDAPSAFVVMSFDRRVEGLTVRHPELPERFDEHLRTCASGRMDLPLTAGAEALLATVGGRERLAALLADTDHAGFVPMLWESGHDTIAGAVGSMSFDPLAHWREFPEDRDTLLETLERKLTTESTMGWERSFEALARLDWAAAKRVGENRRRPDSPTLAAVRRYESTQAMVDSLVERGLLDRPGPPGTSVLDTLTRNHVATEFLEKTQGAYGYDTPLRCLASRAGMPEARFDDAQPGEDEVAVGYLDGKRFEVDIDSGHWISAAPILSLLNRMAEEVDLPKRFLRVGPCQDEHVCVLIVPTDVPAQNIERP